MRESTTMKRIANLLATVALAAGLSVVAAPAQADEPTRGQIGTCLGQLRAGHLEDDCAPVIWTHLAGVSDARQADVETIDRLTADLAAERGAHQQTRLALQSAVDDVQLLLARIDAQQARLARRAAKIAELRAELRDGV